VTGKVKKKRQIRISGFGLPAIGTRCLLNVRNPCGPPNTHWCGSAFSLLQHSSHGGWMACGWCRGAQATGRQAFRCTSMQPPPPLSARSCVVYHKTGSAQVRRSIQGVLRGRGGRGGVSGHRLVGQDVLHRHAVVQLHRPAPARSRRQQPHSRLAQHQHRNGSPQLPPTQPPEPARARERHVRVCVCACVRCDVSTLCLSARATNCHERTDSRSEVRSRARRATS
jgi:hypothetical protein